MTFQAASAVSAAALLSLAPPAFAQQPETEEDVIVLGAITVTVQKREEALRDVPLTLSALDEDTLDALNLDEFDQVARFVPGFEVQEQSPNNPGFVIRGITSDSGEANIEPRIAVFQDGVSISRSRGSIVELFDMERIEVAKGPQPTLFGRGALIGGVNIIQAKPEFEFGGEITAGIGNYEERYLDGYITGPIVEDVLAFRLAGRLRQRDGYVESVNPNEEDFNSQDMAAIRASLAYTPFDALRFDLIFNYQEDNPSGTSFKSGAFEPEPGRSTAPWDPANLNSFGDFLGGKKLGLEREVISTTLLAEWAIDENWTLNSITGARSFESLEVFDPDGFGLPLFVFAEDAEGDQFSQEFRLSYDAGGPLRGFAGISYLNEDGRQNVPLTYDERAVQAFLGGAIVPPNAPPVEALPDFNIPFFEATGQILPLKPIHNEFFANSGKTEAIDLFIDGTYAVTDRLELTAGLRWTQDDKTTGIEVGNLNGPSNLTFGGIFVTAATPPADTATGVGRLTESDTFDDFTWRLAAKFALNEDWNLFANTARGRRPEVITASTTDAENRFETLPAEEVDSYELGAKGVVLAGDLALDASVFYYDYTNFQTSIIDEDTGQVVPLNAGNATSYGLEAQASWTVTDMVALTASYGYNRARFEDEVNGQPQQFGGNPLRLSPDHTASLAARLGFDLGRFGELTIVPSYTWQSEVFFDNTERDLISEDAYGLLNLNAELSFENGFAISAYASNLLDEEYIIDAGNTGDAFGIPTFIAGPPLFYGVRASYGF